MQNVENNSAHQLVEQLVKDWLNLPEVAQILDIPVTKVHRLIETGNLLQVRDEETKIRKVPALFLQDSQVVAHLPGTINLLRDKGFSSEEIIIWLFEEDDTLPGRPIDQLRNSQRGEVRRRAQAM